MMTLREALPFRVSNWRAAPIGLRYAAVSVTCAVLNNILLICLAAGGLDPMIAAAVVVVPMLIIGFVLQVAVVFQEPATWRAFQRYCAAMLSNQPMWFASLYLLCDVIRLPVFIAGPIATVALFVWNFVATRWAIRRGASFSNVGASRASGTDR